MNARAAVAERLATPAILPAGPGCGIGLRPPLAGAMAAARSSLSWIEAHAENHMDGDALDVLLDFRRDVPVALHGVGLSLGSAGRIDRTHLERFAQLVRHTEPIFVSEHLAWSRLGDAHFNDLLPVPYTEEALRAVARNVDEAQEAFGRAILIENPSRYLKFSGDAIGEPDFLAELCRRTGCRLLLDVNNIHVSAENLGFDACAYLARIPAEAVGEFHLAGHSAEEFGGGPVLIDTHGTPVSDAVWTLYAEAVARIGPRPTLIERDRNFPDLAELLHEARRAEAIASEAAARSLS